MWKKQADGSFRVILDIGVQPPGEVRVRARLRPRCEPGHRESAGVSSRSRAHAARGGQGVLGRGRQGRRRRRVRPVMHPQARLHRNGIQPLTSRDDAAKWLASQVKAMTSEPLKSETGASGDLGYTWGKATVTGTDDKPVDGYYVRLWTFDAGKGWLLVADITPA